MTSLNHSINLCLVTLPFLPSTPPPSSAASPSSPSSNGWTKKITKKIQELKNELENVNNLKITKNGYLTEKDSKSLDSLSTQLTSLGTVQKLAEFADQLDTTKNDGNNILNNLCTGLQTFLGFNSASKGYTGQGIVYSDLDRLCDGVMGFLSGVLGAVKDENEVTTYDKNITPNIDTVISKLTKQIGSGREGLAASVEQVKGWLEGYDEKLQEKTLHVINDIGKLRDDISGIYTTNISAGENLQTQLTRWQSTVNDIDNYLSNTEKQYVNKLDNSLRTKIMHDIEKIKSAVSMLIDSSRNPQLKEYAEKVDVTLVDEKKILHNAINTQCENLQEKLREQQGAVYKAINDGIEKVKETMSSQFANIYNNIGDLRETRRKQFALIWKGFKDAKEDLAILNRTFTDELIYHLNDVRAKVMQIDPENTAVGALEYESKLKRDVVDIRRNVFNIREMLEVYLQNMDVWISDTKDALRSAHDEVANILKTVEDAPEGKKRHVETAASTLRQSADDLFRSANDAKTQVRKLIGTVPMEIERRLRAALERDLTGLRDAIKTKVGTYVEIIIQKLNEAAGQANIMNGYPGGKQLMRDMSTVSEFPSLKNLINNAFVSSSNGLAEPLERLLKKLDQLKSDTSKLPAEFKSALERQVTAAYTELETPQTVGFPTGKTLTSNFDAATTPAINDNIDKFRTEGIRQLEDLISDAGGAGADEKITKETFQKLFDDLKLHLDNLCDEVRVASVVADKHFDLLREDRIDNRLGKGIKDKIDALRMEDLPGIINAVNSILVLIQDLEKAPSKVEEKKKDIIKLMGHLQEGIEAEIQKIEKVVSNADSVFVAEISYMENTVRNTYHNIKAGVSELHTQLLAIVQVSFEKSHESASLLQHNLLDEITQSFRNITQHVQKLSAKQHVADLKALEKTLGTAFVDMNITIDNDLKSGLKGLLRWMGGDLEVSGIKSVDNQLLKLKKILTPSGVKIAPPQKKFKEFSEAFKNYYNVVHNHIKFEVTDQTSPSPTEPPTDPANKLTKIKDDFDKLLTHLSDSNDSRKYNYDHPFTEKLASLKDATNDLSPSAFANPRHPELLDAVRAGLEGFVEEMGRVYVNGYDGKTIKWTEYDGKEDKLTAHGKNGAKVFLSIIPIVATLIDINKTCMKNKWCRVAVFKTNSNNPVAKYLKENGYDIPSSRDKQDGELKRDLTGMIVASKITDGKKLCDEMGRGNGKLQELYDYLKYYYEVCHLSTLQSKKNPCSVFEVLCWFTGLPHNPVYVDFMSDGFTELFDKPDDIDSADVEEPGKDGGPMFIDLNSQTLAANPRDIRYSDMHDAITHITHQSHDLLTTILGTGDGYTIYACDLSSNLLNLQYPKRAEDCLSTFVDMLRRILPCLHFLRSQCSLSSSLSGWSQCLYGKDINTAKLPCTDHSSDELNDKSTCQPKSPLQSYLNDCLPGHLPHQLVSIGCQAKCNNCTTSTPGVHCLMPLGFRSFSRHIHTGVDLCNVLNKFFDSPAISCLFAIMPKPPATLPEHFGFALSLVKEWVNTAKLTGDMKTKLRLQSRLQSTVESSIDKLSISLCSSPSVLTNALISAYGSESGVHQSCKDHHLRSLTNKDICINEEAKVKCAPYITTLCCDSYNYLAYKHSDTYVSWAAYLPWNFWNCLNNLYEDFCNIFCQEWGCQKCLRGDKCKGGQHGLKDEKTEIPHCRCQSIVGCKGVSPTLYKYGLAFGNASVLNKIDNEKTCYDFCTQLSKVLKSQYFTELFKQCDDFLFIIRQPFIWLNVALWLLSFIYLLHIMVMRLDLLHIKSHLHTPSSHRIAAQSLLAAGRVNKLNRVFYLQP